MVMMLLSGTIALQKLNVQFFPNFELDVITVSTVWSGASSEDIETGITIPLEQRLRSIDRLKELSSTSATGASGITLEFDEHSDMTFALAEVKKQVDDFTNLPDDAERPKVAQIVRYESVARLLISGPAQFDELRLLARQFERELISAGIDKVDIRGLPKQQLQIELSAEQLQRLGVGLDELARRIDAESKDLPAGLIGEDDGAREIRSQNQRRTPQDFANLAIVSEPINAFTWGISPQSKGAICLVHQPSACAAAMRWYWCYVEMKPVIHWSRPKYCKTGSPGPGPGYPPTLKLKYLTSAGN